MMGVLIRDREKTRAHRGEGCAEMEAGIGEMQPQGMSTASRSWKRQGAGAFGGRAVLLTPPEL